MSGRATGGFRLLQITDLHLFGDTGRTLYGVETARSLQRVLEQAFAPGTPRPDAIVVTGDVADDLSPAAYANFHAALEPWRLPVYCVPGNHDAPALMSQALGAGRFQFGGRARFGAWDALFVDTHVDGRPEGCVAPAELARVDRELAAMRGPVLLCLHHPPLPVGSAWLDAVGLENADALLAVIDRHASVRAVLCGHVHQAFDRSRNGVRVLATPSTCAQFMPGTERCVMDLEPPGYRWLELLDDGGLRTEVCWLAGWAVTERPPDDRF